MQQSSQTVALIFGCPGSGKTSLARKLQPDFAISGDEVEWLLQERDRSTLLRDYGKLTLNPQIQYQFSPTLWKESRELQLNILEKYLREHEDRSFLLVIEDDFLLQSQRKAVYQLCRSVGVGYVELLLNLPLQRLEATNRDREEPKRLPPEKLQSAFYKLEREELKNQIVLADHDYDVKELRARIVEMSARHRVECAAAELRERQAQEDSFKNKTNIAHQTDLELRKVVSELCKKKEFDPKYLSEKKQWFLKNADLGPDAHQNVQSFLKQL